MPQHRRCQPVGWRVVALALCALIPCLRTQIALGELVDLNIRCEWAGETAERWQGVFRLSSGTFHQLQPLGMQADTPGSMLVSGNRILIYPGSHRRYDGFDVVLQAPRDAQLFIELMAIDQRQPVRVLEIPVSRLIDGFDETTLEPTDQRLFIRRAPGDMLRVRADRSLIFAPGETMTLEVIPHQIALSPGDTVELVIELLRSRSEEVIASQRLEMSVAADSTVPAPATLALDVPGEDGTYVTRLTLHQRRMAGRLVPKSFVPDKVLAQRNVEFVVVGSPIAPAPAVPWTQLLEIDPVNPTSRWHRLIAHIPGFDKGPLKHGQSSTTTILNQSMMSMAADSWQAYPLSIRNVDQPHLVEIEYPDSQAQTLGIAVVEPNPAGVLEAASSSGGLDVPELPVGQAPQLRRHQVPFWPRTRTPLLLLTNWRAKEPAAFGRIRVYAGPERLPEPTADGVSAEQRLVIASCEIPRLTETFGAGRQFEPTRDAMLDDWSTFYLAAARWIEHLRYSGYNGASITAVADGSALYPSPLLQPTPRFDTGTFLASGSDPWRKDVLELLFRLFDQHGLKLIPTVEFTQTLPELENLKRSSGGAGRGISLVDQHGQSWMQRHATPSGSAPHYNPLDDRVQRAMRRVIAELVDRYGDHPSFAGVGVRLTADGYTQLPDEDWGLDETTVRQFYQDVAEPLADDASIEDAIQRLRGPLKTRWLNWRAHKLAELYQAIQQDLDKRTQHSVLYLIPDNLLEATRFWDEVRPTLPPQSKIGELLLRLGVDPRLNAANPSIVLMRPYCVEPTSPPVHDHALTMTLNDSSAVHELFDHGDLTGLASTHLRLSQRVPSFEQENPWGIDKTVLRLGACFTPSGLANRQRFIHGLAAGDKQLIVDGGESLPLGGEVDLQPLLDTFRRLPVARFNTVSARAGDSVDRGVVVRELALTNQRYVYLVNDSPWPLSVDLRLILPRNCGVVPLGNRPPGNFARQNGFTVWTVELQPYDLHAALFTSAEARIDDWRVRMDAQLQRVVADGLRARLSSVRNRATSLDEPVPFAGLVNANFEDAAGLTNGWVHAEGTNVLIDTMAGEGNERSTALRIRQRGSVGANGPFAWVRSDPIPSPASGRIAVSLWLRIPNGAPQPPLRVAIEGKHGSDDFYRFYKIGAGNGVDRLSPQWTPFLFPFNNLPPGGLTDLRIGIDLMGKGEVMVDDVQILDLCFRSHERHQLMLDVGRAGLDLNEGNLVACARFLDSYWSRLLLENVSLPQARVATNTPDVVSAPPLESPPDDAPATPEKSSTWQNLKQKANGFVPKLPSLW